MADFAVSSSEEREVVWSKPAICCFDGAAVARDVPSERIAIRLDRKLRDRSWKTLE